MYNAMHFEWEAAKQQLKMTEADFPGPIWRTRSSLCTSGRQFGRSTQWGEISEVLERLDSTHVIKADRRFLFLAGRSRIQRRDIRRSCPHSHGMDRNEGPQRRRLDVYSLQAGKAK